MAALSNTFRTLVEINENALRRGALSLTIVEQLVNTSDSIAEDGVKMYLEFNPNARDSEEVGLAEYEEALKALAASTVQLIEPACLKVPEGLTRRNGCLGPVPPLRSPSRRPSVLL